MDKIEIRKEEWSFPAANGEGDIFARAWLVENPAAVIQIVHGMSEHSGRYDEFASYLCLNGFAVVANDHAGHGQSAQGHLGAFAKKAGGFDWSVEDMHRLYILAEEKIGPLPLFLFGHSMGSALSALYAERYTDITALALSGIPYAIKSSRMFQFLAGLISAFRGHHVRSPLLERLTAAATEEPREEGEDERRWLSRDKEKVREFKEDPLCGFEYTAGGYTTMLRSYHYLISKKWGHKVPDIPILFVAGEDDVASDYGNGPRAYAAQLTATGHTKVDVHLFPDCRHEITNELNRQEVYKFICDWFKEKLVL